MSPRPVRGAQAGGSKSGRNTRSAQTESLSDKIQTHTQIAKSSAAKLLKRPASSFGIVFVIAVSLLLPALLISLNNNLSEMLRGFQSSAQITLYLREGVSDSRAQEVSDNLLTRNSIEHALYVSPTEALDEFADATGLDSLLQEIGNNPLPGAILVSPTSVAPEAVEALAASLEELAEVELVQVDSRWIARLEAISELVNTVARLLCAIVILGLFFVVGNTIKLAVENRKAEIRVIKLVGGSDMFAARPFLYSGLFYGCAGGILAATLQGIVLISINSSLEAVTQLYESDFQLSGFGPVNSLIVITSGAFIGWGSAFLASLRHIRQINP